MKNKLLIIRWATATGKTNLSIQIARQTSILCDFGMEPRPVEIISADSRQIYKYMDIGTDKIDQEIRKEIPHHMIDIVDPKDTYTAGQWKQDVEVLIDQIFARGHQPIVVWGTGLYIDTLYKNYSMPDVPPDRVWREEMMKQEDEKKWFLYDELMRLDPVEAMKHHPNSTRYLVRALEICHFTWSNKTELCRQHPVQWPLYMLWLWREKEDTNMRINARIKDMMSNNNLIAENKRLLDMWYTLDHTAMNGIWYKEIVSYIQGEYDIEKAKELLRRHTHRYAKRQRSRFRRYIAEWSASPKENVEYELRKLSQ